jgi:hypothetical protein
MQKREGYTHRMTHQLRAWMARFEASRREATKVGVTMAAELRERFETMQVAGAAALAKLTELRRARARYGKVRKEMELIWRSIDDGAPDAEPREPLAAARKRATDA